MPYEFGLPDLGEGLAAGEVVHWLVEPGDTVTEDQPIVEVETDKALVEIPSPVEGTVRELLAEEGEFVAVDEVIVTFDVEDGSPNSEEATTDERESGGRVIDFQDEEVIEETPVDPDGQAEAEDEGETGRRRTRATPAARRVAREKGVDIDAVPLDEDGFITPEQVQVYAEREEALDGANTQPAAKEAEPDDERIPYRGVRRTIGEQMQRATAATAHVSHHDEADVTDLVAMRERLKPHAAAEDGTLTYMPFVLKAVVAGLKDHPLLNSHLDEEAEEIVLRRVFHIGIAVATDAGLMVPVIRNVDEKGLLAIARELADLADRARDRTIEREEMQDGTFTVTNYGRIGGTHSTPIINYPEVAILGLGEIAERARVVDGDIVARTTLPLSISIDHRVVDGADAARFVNTVIEHLESPDLLLLDE